MKWTRASATALRNLERSDIGTIHSFAANLLRLYPIEAGVDPQFREDDGAEFDRLFDEQWDAWLDQELALRRAPAPTNGAKFSRAASSIKSKPSLDRSQRKPSNLDQNPTHPTKSPRRCALGSAN